MSSPPELVRILLVGQDEDEQDHIRVLLEDAPSLDSCLEWQSDYHQGLDLVLRSLHELILVGPILGERTCAEFIADARSRGCLDPMIILGSGESDAEQLALDAGADAVLDRARLNATTLQRTLLDALERRRTKDSLRATESRFDSVMEGLREGIVITDLAGRILYVNEQMANLTGHDRNGLLEQNYARTLLPKETRYVEQQLLARRARGLSDDYECRIIRADGSKAWMRVHGSPLRDPKGRVEGVVSAHSDISASKRAEEALAGSERRFRAIFESAAMGVVSLDREGNVVESNAHLHEMLGADDDELRGTALSDRIHPDDRDLAVQLKHDLVDGQLDQAQREIRLLRSDGREIWTAATISLIADERTSGGSVIVVIEDITSRKEMEEELLLSQRLEAIGKLSGGIAHSFNNLLTIILGRSGLVLSEAALDERLRPHMETLHATADRGAQLTRQLLAFGRKQRLEPVELDLCLVVREMEGMIRHLVREDIELFIELRECPGVVKVDRAKIEQVLMNLVVNARDAMPEGGKLTVETAPTELDEDYIRAHPGGQAGPHFMLSVSDTGTGMDAETRGRIFEPFFTTKPKGVGTGLGLSTVYGTVNQSGGSVWVYSEPGCGSTFKVFLPLIETEKVAQPEAARVEPELLPRASSRGSETILVVEDEEPVRAVAVEILESRGYRVLQAGGGAEALEIAKGFDDEIHLILSDVVMPHMSGPELQQLMRDARPGIPVLFTSGYPDRGVVRSGLLRPETPFLQKPFTTESLSSTVRGVLDRSDRARQSQA